MFASNFTMESLQLSILYQQVFVIDFEVCSVALLKKLLYPKEQDKKGIADIHHLYMYKFGRL